MAEFVAKRCEDMIPELEQMERLKLFDKNEIRYVFEVNKCQHRCNILFIILI